MPSNMRFESFVRFVVQLLVLFVSWSAIGRAEVLVRWDQPQIPPRDALGVSTLVVSAANKAAVDAALARIGLASHGGAAPLLTYPWKPITLSDIDAGPRLEDYLVAIADAGSVGGNLVLPLHERFQKNLLLGKPQARQWWQQIRR